MAIDKKDILCGMVEKISEDQDMSEKEISRSVDQ